MQGKKIALFSISGILLCGMSLMAQTKVPDVVGMVNGEKITKAQLVDALLDWRGSSTLDDMIQMKLIEQEAKKAKITVKQDEINERIIEIKRSLPPNADYLEFLKSKGLTPNRLSAIFTMQIRAEKLVGKNIKVTPQDLAQYIKASHILISINPGPGATEEETTKLDQEAKQKIDSILAEIKSGAITFEDAAEKYSTDTGTKGFGGDLNWFMKGQMVPEFEKAALALEINQISEPVKTDFGYHIIKLTGVGEKASASDKAVLEESISKSKLNAALPQWLDSVRKNAKIENYLAPKPKASVPAKPTGKKPADKTNSDIQMPPPPPGN